MSTSRFLRMLVPTLAAVLATAAAAPAAVYEASRMHEPAASQPYDLRSPDTQDRAAAVDGQLFDLRSPDTRHRALAPDGGMRLNQTEQRSDAGAVSTTTQAFDFTETAVAAAGGLGLLLVLGGIGFVLSGRRLHVTKP